MNDSIDINDLILYVHIVNKGSFSGAADELKKTKSTLSRRMDMLEKNLGGKILKRGVKGVTVTAFGQEIFEMANVIQSQSIELLNYIKRRKEALRGTLKISVPHDFVELVPESFFADFTSRYPDINLELDLSNLNLETTTTKFDLQIRMSMMGLPADEDLILHRICDFERGVYANPLLFKHKNISHPNDLLAYTGLLFVASDEKIVPWRLYNKNETWSGTPKQTIKGNSVGAMRSLAKLGRGVIILTHILAKQMVEENYLMPVLSDWHADPVTMYAISTSRQNLLPAKTRVFIEALRAAFVTLEC